MDLWPYVNGKSLTLGLRLAEMELSDMLDVIHFLFEEDSSYVSAEQAESVNAMRTALYSKMYKTTYRYGVSSSSKSSTSGDFGPDSTELKPYIPPTEFNAESYTPFGQTLDAPIG